MLFSSPWLESAVIPTVWPLTSDISSKELALAGFFLFLGLFGVLLVSFKSDNFCSPVEFNSDLSFGGTPLSSSSEPRWASVNRGVLICDECCSVHRSLGRHSSQVRHLTHTPWPATQLQVREPNKKCLSLTYQYNLALVKDFFFPITVDLRCTV